MNRKLKTELALIGAGLSFLTRRSQNRWIPMGLAFGSAALLTSSFRKNFSLDGHRVLITGGSRGLGLSLAWNLLERGAKVTLVARDYAELARGRELLLRDFPGADIFIISCDITQERSLHSSLSQAIEHMGGVDLLVNNAGAIMVGPFETMKAEDFRSQIEIHLMAPLNAIQYMLPRFIEQGGGRVLNICSLGGKVAVPHMLPYDASKFALSGFAQGASAELSKYGVKITTAYPTVMRTGSPIQAIFKGDQSKEFGWFYTLDNLPLLSMSADRAAKKILDAVESERTEIILSLPAQARSMLGALFPETMNSLMELAARLLPNGKSMKAIKGSEIRERVSRSWWGQKLTHQTSKVEAMYNQVPDSLWSDDKSPH
jgi:short-subunit dehydrogenase